MLGQPLCLKIKRMCFQVVATGRVSPPLTMTGTLWFDQAPPITVDLAYVNQVPMGAGRGYYVRDAAGCESWVPEPA